MIEESSGSTHLSAFAKREETAAKSVNEDVYRREHAEQVGIVVAMYAFLISAIFIFPPFFLFFAPFEWIKYLFLFYVAWYFVLDRDACEKGTRFLGWTRRLPFWRLAAGYFPVRLHKSADLDPSKNYIFGYHPHGVISVGALLTFASEATGFANAFPGIDVRLLTLSVNFFFPFTREVLMALGINSVTRSSVEKNLLRVKSSAAKKPRGNAVVIVVGGANEAMDAHPGTAILTLAKRKGFVRLALKTGADVGTCIRVWRERYIRPSRKPGGWRFASVSKAREKFNRHHSACVLRSLVESRRFETIFRQTRRLAEAPIDRSRFR